MNKNIEIWRFISNPPHLLNISMGINIHGIDRYSITIRSIAKSSVSSSPCKYIIINSSTLSRDSAGSGSVDNKGTKSVCEDLSLTLSYNNCDPVVITF